MPTSIASCKINKINKIFVFFSGKYNVLRGSSGKAGDMFYYKIFWNNESLLNGVYFE